MTVTEAVVARRATSAFNPTVLIGREELIGLMNRACLAPSALNLQPWRFLIIDSIEEKERLSGACFGQRKVQDASASIVVLGDLRHHDQAQRVLEGQEWLDLAVSTYSDPQKARDECIRGGSLWAMTFTLLAVEAGWDTALVGGFDSDRIARSFSVPARYLPVLVVSIGRKSPDAPAKERGARLGVEELLL